MSKRRVGIQLPKQAQNQTVEQRYALELEGLAPVADIIENFDTQTYGSIAGDGDRALREYRRVLSLEPGHGEARQVVARLAQP